MNEELKAELKALGLTDEQIAAIESNLGVTSRDDMKFVTAAHLGTADYGINAKPVITAKVLAHFAVEEGEKVEKPVADANEVNKFAGAMGMDPTMLTTFLFANMSASSGMEFDLSSMMPIEQIAGSYSPKIKNVPYMIMGQIEKRLGTPIVVINADGSVNAALTREYIMSLEEGFEAAPDNVYYDTEGAPYEIIKVGVDAQSVYDADPLDPSRALNKNGMGVGRVNWHNVPLDVRQVVYFAANVTNEIRTGDEAQYKWLRTNINPKTTRLILRGEYPQALSSYNEAARTGALPTLRVQLSRGARRPEVMPRRRPYNGRTGGAAGSDAGFRNDDEL